MLPALCRGELTCYNDVDTLEIKVDIEHGVVFGEEFKGLNFPLSARYL